jgi:hypothetical protein
MPVPFADGFGGEEGLENVIGITSAGMPGPLSSTRRWM